MSEFLVHFEVTLPPFVPRRLLQPGAKPGAAAALLAQLPSGLSEAQRAGIYADEEKAAAPYFANGTFKRVWRVPGSRDHWALWDAPDADYVHRAYESFPLFRLNYGRATVIPLAVNENDPGTPARECPDIKMTYPVLRALLDKARAEDRCDAAENGLYLCPAVSVHDHPGTDRARQLHFMVDDLDTPLGRQKIAELGPRADEGERETWPSYVDFLAEWTGRPVLHAKWIARIRQDNNLLHPSYEEALAAPRHRHHTSRTVG